MAQSPEKDGLFLCFREGSGWVWGKKGDDKREKSERREVEEALTSEREREKGSKLELRERSEGDRL